MERPMRRGLRAPLRSSCLPGLTLISSHREREMERIDVADLCQLLYPGEGSALRKGQQPSNCKSSLKCTGVPITKKIVMLFNNSTIFSKDVQEYPCLNFHNKLDRIKNLGIEICPHTIYFRYIPRNFCNMSLINFDDLFPAVRNKYKLFFRLAHLLSFFRCELIRRYCVTTVSTYTTSPTL